MSRNAGLENVDPDVKMYYAVRQSFVLRMAGKLDDSDQVIQESFSANRETIERVNAIYTLSGQELDGIRDQITPLRRFNAIYGQLIGAQAMNLFERAEFVAAIRTFKRWKLLPAASSHLEDRCFYEARVQVKNLANLGLVNMTAGNYEEAQLELQSAFRAYDDGTGARFDVMAYLSDVYCEQGCPENGIYLLEPEIKKIKADDHLEERHHRNLVVSYGEACICAGRYHEAEVMLQKVKRHFDSVPSIAPMDQQRHTRTLILLAQNLHRQAKDFTQWTCTMARWMEVVSIAQKCDVLSATSWDFGMICFSISHVALELGRREESRKWFRDGTAILNSRGRFWRRGMSTYWREFISQRLTGFGEVMRSGDK